jgi:P27 family predicted phage terminase small subunit
MARAKTPNAILKKRGSKHARENEPEVRAGKVSATRSMTPEGQRAFDRICAELDTLGILSPTYAEMITIAADAVGDIEIASADLMERGHISVTERGETKNPSWTIKVSAQQIAHRYLTALGLSPTAIGKLTGAEKKEENEFLID